MKRGFGILALLLALLALSAAFAEALPEEGELIEDEWADEFWQELELPEEDADSFAVMEESAIEGTWVSVQEASLEFCLPEGWQVVDSAAGALFSAASDAGRLDVRLEASDVEEDIEAHMAALGLEAELVDAGGYTAAMSADGSALTLRLVTVRGDLVAFCFDGVSEETALEIVSTLYEVWTDEEFEAFIGGEDAEVFEVDLEGWDDGWEDDADVDWADDPEFELEDWLDDPEAVG